MFDTAVAENTPQLATGVIDVAGRSFMEDAKGNLVPLDNIKPADKLQDETVRAIMKHAVALNAQLARFRSHTMADLGALDALLAEQYGAKIGGANAIVDVSEQLMRNAEVAIKAATIIANHGDRFGRMMPMIDGTPGPVATPPAIGGAK
jgi:hypothetical protein